MFGAAAASGSFSYTPQSTGKLHVCISTSLQRGDEIGSQLEVKIKYGTGAAPAQNAVDTGTDGSILLAAYGSTADTVIIPATCVGLITGLSVGVTYWFDLACKSVAASKNATVYFATITIIEL